MSPFSIEDRNEDERNATNPDIPESTRIHAMVNVGCAYWRGDGGERDLAKARMWLMRAVAAGDPYAPQMLRALDAGQPAPGSRSGCAPMVMLIVGLSVLTAMLINHWFHAS
jgi:TPR repeat protein